MAAMEFTINKLKTYESNKHIQIRNTTLKTGRDLGICNYTEQVQHRKLWDEVTLNCRSLVADMNSGEIIARSFPKFFNFDELPVKSREQLATYSPSIVYEKLDGCLILIFNVDDEWIIASKGSFHSAQVAQAKSIIKDTGIDLNVLNKDIAYTFELIYPEQRIVVYYGEERSLNFLAAFKRDGCEVTDTHEVQVAMTKLGIKCAPTWHGMLVTHSAVNLEALQALNLKNKEGFVVLYKNVEVNGTRYNTFRVKLKFKDYILLHRTQCGLTPKRVYDAFVSGIEKEAYVLQFKEDEIQREASKIWDSFVDTCNHYEKLAIEENARMIEEFQRENGVLDLESKIHRNKLVQIHKELQIKVPLDWIFIIHSGKSLRSKLLSKIKV